MSTEWMENAKSELLQLPEEERGEYISSALQLIWAYTQMQREKPLLRIGVCLDAAGNFDVIATHEE